MKWTMRDALVEIAARAPSVAHEALKTLGASGRTVGMRYQWLLTQALRDPEAQWTTEERRALVALLEPPGERGRTDMISLRLTEAERAAIEAQAEDAGMTVSEYVRRKALGE